jgi:general stress protein 26
MSTPQELQTKFWSALKSDRTVMLGLAGVDDGHTRPMTAQVEGDRGPIWFFTTKEAAIASDLGNGRRAIAAFASKGHNLFATVHGSLTVDNSREVIDRLWNAHVATWYNGGKDDPALTLLRLDAEKAEIWLDGSNLIAGIRMLLGGDPKQTYKENVAVVHLK